MNSEGRRKLDELAEEHGELNEKVNEDRIKGLPPQRSLNLEMYSGQSIPNDWDIVGTTGDILMVEYADCDPNNENVMRDGILVPLAATQQHVWRVGRIVHAGPGASESATPTPSNPEIFVLFPYDKGIPMSSFDGKNYIFINEERIFCFVKPKEKRI